MGNIFQNIISDNTFLGLNDVPRWGRKRTLRKETVGGHSHDVALMIRALIEEIFPSDEFAIKLEILTYAQVHDFEEVFSGDIVHSVKYNNINGDDIKEALKKFCDGRLQEYFGGEDKSAKMFLDSTLNPSKHAKDLVKVVDWISMAIFSKTEIKMGNTDFESVLTHCIRNLTEACNKAIATLQSMSVETDITILNQIKLLDWYESRRT